MSAHLALSGIAIAIFLGISAHAGTRSTSDRFPRTLVPTPSTAAISNPYFPLASMVRMEFIESKGGETTFVSFSSSPVLDTIDGIICRGLRERVVRRGQLIEESIEWFAQDTTGAVWFFGEHIQRFRKGKVSTGGSWESGIKGATEGRFLPGRPVLTAPFRRSLAMHVSEEMAQVLHTRDSVTVTAGHFENCLRVKEWSMLESGHSISWYAPGVGLVRSVSTDGDILELHSYSRDSSKSISTKSKGK